MMFLKTIFRQKNLFHQTIPKIFNFQFSFTYQTEKLFQKISEKELCDKVKIKELLKTNFKRKTKRSQRGLFHKKQPKTGNQSCFSEKKSRRWWKPNIQTKLLYSKILEKYMSVEVSTKMLRCMRKYGGFDNYILLTKPKDLDSIFGEYLRTLMLKKLNDPNFKVPYIAFSHKFKFPYTNRHLYRKEPIIHPLNIRNTDLTHLKLKTPQEMNRKELKEFEEISELENNLEDLQTNHPTVLKMQEKEKREMKLLEPEREKAIAMFNRHKSKKEKELVTEFIEEGLFEFKNPNNKEYVTQRKMRQNK